MAKGRKEVAAPALTPAPAKGITVRQLREELFNLPGAGLMSGCRVYTPDGKPVTKVVLVNKGNIGYIVELQWN